MSAVNFSDNNAALYYARIKNSLQGPLECPLAVDIPENPVVDPHGHTFEKKMILLTQKKIDGQDCVQCPKTYEWIPIDRLYPNKAVEQVAQKTKEFTKELKRLNRLDSQSLPQEEIIKRYEGKIIELTAIHELDIQRLGELQREVQRKDGQIQVLQKAIQERDIKIKKLENQVVELKNQYDILEGRIVKYEEEIEDMKVSFGNELREVKIELKNKDLELKSKEKRTEEIESNIASFENTMREMSAKLESQNTKLKNNEQKIESQNTKLKNNEQKIWQLQAGAIVCTIAGITLTKILTNK